ncbi:lysophospholipase L1-like esterase [Nicoletella semolina]|uniref:Lysophospholipase L1-like esterase n=1 Tax=Nicoletella semolina TaxID=271160 RepID=A0A4R2N581_9PAST|nr:GDSL-type esterase/lipase family protein [Nicoletella semolina]MDH2924791.1 acylneuraminate cytidylyltransferase [Nicoletella semolina]TCP16010.1 lysophospholipase L1-like esterase [Nicoletella semolina]
MLSDQDIFKRFQEKHIEFSKIADVSLVGHSLFDMWENQEGGTPRLAGKTVANLGLSGVSARQYLDVIVRPKHIRQLGRDVFIFLGVNDIVKERAYSPKQLLNWLVDIIDCFKQISPQSRYYLLETTPVNQISTVDNPAIRQLNTHLVNNLPADVIFVPTWDRFVNNEGKLDLTLCHDGLHFSTQGYAILQDILERQL